MSRGKLIAVIGDEVKFFIFVLNLNIECKAMQKKLNYKFRPFFDLHSIYNLDLI